MKANTGIGTRLRLLRKEKRLTQTQLAGQIGIGQTAVANYESGRRFPDEENLVRIADFFGISLDDLVGRDYRARPRRPGERDKGAESGFSYFPSKLESLTDEFMSCSLQSERRGVDMIVRLLDSGYSEEQIMLDLLQASLVKAGRLWDEGRCSEAMEHQLSMTVVQSMSMMRFLAGPSRLSAGRFAALNVTGERHDIGLRMVSRFLELDGWESFFLGGSVPAGSLTDFVNSKSISLVLFSVTLGEHTDSLCSMIRAVKRDCPKTAVLAGGLAAGPARSRITAAGADFISDSVSSMMEILQRLK